MTRNLYDSSCSSGTWATCLGAAWLMISGPAAAGLFDAAVSGQTTGTDSSTAATSQGTSPSGASVDTDTASTEGAAGTDASAGTAPSGAGTETATSSVPPAAASQPTVLERIVEKSGLAFDFNGHLRGDCFVGKMPTASRAEIKNGYGELALKLKVSRAPYGDAYGEVRFQGGYINDEHYLGQPTGAQPQGYDIGEFQTRIKLREAYVNFYGGSHFDLKFGYQIIVWGRADGINPTNNLTPIDMRVRSPEEDDRRLGNLALRANLNFNPIRIEGVWVPFYQASYMPKISLPESIVFDKPNFPNMNIARGTYAGKIHLLLSQIEMSLSYLYGYSLQPGLAHSSNNLEEVGEQVAFNRNLDGGFIGATRPIIATDYMDVDTALVHVRRTAYQQHVAGFDFSTDIAGKVGLRGEFAFKYPKDFKDSTPSSFEEYEKDSEYQVAVPFPELNYVLGIDKEFGNVSLILQYVGKTVLKWKKAEENDEDADLNNLNQTVEDQFVQSSVTGWRVSTSAVDVMKRTIYRELALKNRLIFGQTKKIQHAISGRIEWKTLHDALSLSAFGMFNISTLEWVLYPKIAYNITDAMSVALGGEIYQGPDESLFGYIEEIQSAGYTELKITF